VAGDRNAVTRYLAKRADDSRRRRGWGQV